MNTSKLVFHLIINKNMTLIEYRDNVGIIPRFQIYLLSIISPVLSYAMLTHFNEKKEKRSARVVTILQKKRVPRQVFSAYNAKQ